jgi:hypothetical protein
MIDWIGPKRRYFDDHSVIFKTEFRAIYIDF